MPKVSHRQNDNIKKRKPYIYSDLKESIGFLKETATAKFIETVELHANLNINPKYADQQLRATVTLPHGTGKSMKIAILTPKIEEYKKVLIGATLIGNDNLIDKILKGDIDFDLLITTADMMPKLAKLGRILGPRGLMPSPKSGTVTTDLISTFEEFTKGKFEYKADRAGIVHVNFGKSNFTTQQLIENLIAILKSIEQNRPTGVKGKYFKNLYICNSMGPSIEIDLNTII
jgi:large subunit ribosomal protein L1